MSKIIKTLSPSFGSADDILKQLHAHQDEQKAQSNRSLKKKGVLLKPEKPFVCKPVYDLCAQDVFQSSKQSAPLPLSREEQGYSTAGSIKGKVEALLKARMLPAPIA
jgi:hypothetical protein